MSAFTFVCPRARADEAGAHDITDAMSPIDSGGRDDRVLYCRRCGQAIEVRDALAAMHDNLDEPPTITGVTLAPNSSTDVTR